MLDNALTIVLIVLVPVYGVWRSMVARGKPPKAKARKYVRSTLLALGLGALGVANWLLAGRSAAALGMDAPPSTVGWIGLAGAACLLAGLAVAMRLNKREITEDELALLPHTRAELYLFLAAMLVIGTVWELLYRGYLLWALEARVGVVGAVAVASAAYGLAHGWHGPRRLAGSLLFALAFTTAYALTHSLWWLIVIHAGLPSLGALSRFATIKSADRALDDAIDAQKKAGIAPGL